MLRPPSNALKKPRKNTTTMTATIDFWTLVPNRRDEQRDQHDSGHRVANDQKTVGQRRNPGPLAEWSYYQNLGSLGVVPLEVPAHGTRSNGSGP